VTPVWLLAFGLNIDRLPVTQFHRVFAAVGKIVVNDRRIRSAILGRALLRLGHFGFCLATLFGLSLCGVGFVASIRRNTSSSRF